MPRILDVGNCQPDHSTLCAYLKRHFDCEVIQAHGLQDTLQELRRESFDLVTINRKLDRDYSDGVEILKQIKADAELAAVPVMLITNFPEHQEAAVSHGGVPGFGKLEYDRPETLLRLQSVLGSPTR